MWLFELMMDGSMTNYNYRLVGKFGGDNFWRKRMDEDFGKI